MILDTNALSAWCDDDRGLLAVLPSDRPLFLAVIVLGETGALAGPRTFTPAYNATDLTST